MAKQFNLNEDIRFERADFLLQFADADQTVGAVKLVERRRWWAPWSKRKVVSFEGDMEGSAKALFQMWGRLACGGCCTDAY